MQQRNGADAGSEEPMQILRGAVLLGLLLDVMAFSALDEFGKDPHDMPHPSLTKFFRISVKPVITKL